LITTLYLDAAEYAVLEQLPAATVHKTRLSVPPLGIDVFEDALAGLVLAEAEFDDDESLESFIPPREAVAEVTQDQRLTGGNLAATTKAEIEAVLADYGLFDRAR
jgi:CYTH domain-containing protein